MMCWIASVCFCTAKNCWAKSSTVLPNTPGWEMGASRKHSLSTSLISARMALLGHKHGNRLDFCHLESEVSHRAQHQTVSNSGRFPPCAFFLCLGLVDLQDSHGMQGRDSLARSTVGLSNESCCGPTGLEGRRR